MKILSGEGSILREFIENIKDNKFLKSEFDINLNKCIFFPENTLDINEQASYLKNLKDTNVIIFTFSPWIISDSNRNDFYIVNKKNNLFYLKEPDFNTFGSSVNKISLNLFRKSTISDLSLEELEQDSKFLNDNNFSEFDKKFGESVEKILILKNFFNKQDSILNRIKNIIS